MSVWLTGLIVNVSTDSFGLSPACRTFSLITFLSLKLFSADLSGLPTEGSTAQRWIGRLRWLAWRAVNRGVDSSGIDRPFRGSDLAGPTFATG